MDGRPVASLVYRRRQHVISLFVWPQDSSTEITPRELAEKGYHFISWVHSGMAFWAVSDVNPSDLNEFARLVREAP